MDNTAGKLDLPRNIKASVAAGDSPALILLVEPGGAQGDVLTLRGIEQILKANGAENWLLDQEQIRLLQQEQRKLTAPKSYRIAERRDAQVEIHISRDRREAKITIFPARGGEPVSQESISEALKYAGVTCGVIEQRIPELIEKGTCEEVLIAEGTLPTVGTDVQFERLFKESDHKGQPKVNRDGNVDLHDLGLFISVLKGTRLLRRIPPTPGTPGVGVDGSPIPPKRPRDLPLLAGTGAALSPEDPNVLIAVDDGLPIFQENSVRILSKLELQDLDYKTGSVEFVGSISIRGTVQPGFRVKAGGDIVVGETLDTADLTAGGSIHLRAGVFGRGRSHISAKGNIKARFLSECTVYCGGSLQVDDLIANCKVICEGAVEVGPKWGKGQVYGGRILATKGVRARILGSVVDTNTLIQVSPSPVLADRERIVAKEIEDLEHKADQLGRSLLYLQSSQSHGRDSRAHCVEAEYQSIRVRLDELRIELAELSARLQVRLDAKITASQVYPGVTIAMAGRKTELITSPMQFLVFEPGAEQDPLAAANLTADGRTLKK